MSAGSPTPDSAPQIDTAAEVAKAADVARAQKIGELKREQAASEAQDAAKKAENPPLKQEPATGPATGSLIKDFVGRMEETKTPVKFEQQNNVEPRPQAGDAGGSSGIPPENRTAAIPAGSDDENNSQPNAGESQTSTPGKSPEEQEQENPFNVTDADGNPVDAHGRVTREGISESSTETAGSPGGKPPETTQAANTMTPPEAQQNSEAQTDEKTVEARKENDQVNTGVANIMQNADEALMSENPQYQGLKEKQKQVSKDSPEWVALQKQIDEMQHQKAKTLSDNDLHAAAAKGDNVELNNKVRVAAKIHAPEKGITWNLIHKIKNWYANEIDKQPIIESRTRALEMLHYLRENRKKWNEAIEKGGEEGENAEKERKAARASIGRDLKEYGILRMKKFLLKDWPLLSLGMLLLFWLGITYGLHKLSGGK